MRIHHLNTGTMCPIGKRLVNGTGSIFQRARMVCHCLLVETTDDLVLVDTGIGLDDIANPPRLGRKWVRQTTPRLDPSETAVQQVKALGYSPSDVRHLLLTHLDRDHAGGVPDFPQARVHVHRKEYEVAVLQRIPAPKGRYITEQWKHGPDWVFYDEGGEDWFGFKGVRALGDRAPDILMSPAGPHARPLRHRGSGQGQMAAARRRQLFLSWSVAGQAKDAAGARHVPAPCRHGPRHADREPRAAAGAEGRVWRRRDDLQQP